MPLNVGQRAASRRDVAHVHVVRIEAGAVERGGHLDVPVHALLAQDRDHGPRTRGDEGRGDILRPDRTSGVARGPDRRHPAMRAYSSSAASGIVAQALHRVRRRRPRAMEVDARLVEQRRPLTRDRDRVPRRRRADDGRGQSRPPAPRRRRLRRAPRALARRRPTPRRTAPPAVRQELRRARHRGRSATRTPFRPASRKGRHRRCRDRRAACRRHASRCTSEKNAARRCGSSRSGASLPSWP